MSKALVKLAAVMIIAMIGLRMVNNLYESRYAIANELNNRANEFCQEYLTPEGIFKLGSDIQNHSVSIGTEHKYYSTTHTTGFSRDQEQEETKSAVGFSKD